MRWRFAVVVALFVLALVGLYLLARPPYIFVPIRQYPPDNAYNEIKRVMETVWKASSVDERLRNLRYTELTAEDYTYLLNRYQPFIQQYIPLMDRPSKPIYDYYEYDKTFRELSSARQYADIEALLMSYELQNGLESRAVQRFERLLKLSHQISNDGYPIHHVVGNVIARLGSEPILRFGVRQPQNRELIVRAAREYLNRLPELSELAEEQKRQIDALYQKLLTANWQEFQETVSELERRTNRSPGSLFTYLKSQITLKSAYAEIVTFYDAVSAELRKPPWERDFSKIPQPEHYINTLIFLSPSAPFYNALEDGRATIRLIGVLYAIRLHKQKTGQYPKTLQELNLGAMTIDPFTGRPLIYRTDPQKGFQLYSVGANRVDDGGRLSLQYGSRALFVGSEFGDIVPYLPKTPKESPSATVIRPASSPHLTPPIWFR